MKSFSSPHRLLNQPPRVGGRNRRNRRPKKILRAVAAEFGLDTAFDEDRSRVRTDHGPENLGVFRRIALSLLRRDKSCKVGVKNKRVKAGRNRDYLIKVLLSPAKAK